MNSIAKSWIRVCALDDLSPDQASELIIGGQRLAIARYGDKVSIFQGFCSHMLFPLSGSDIKDCVLTCSLHQSKFDVRDGSVVEWSNFPPLIGPALALIRQRKALRTYQAKIENGDVYILWTVNPSGNVAVRLKTAILNPL